MDEIQRILSKPEAEWTAAERQMVDNYYAGITEEGLKRFDASPAPPDFVSAYDSMLGDIGTGVDPLGDSQRTPEEEVQGRNLFQRIGDRLTNINFPKAPINTGDGLLRDEEGNVTGLPLQSDDSLGNRKSALDAFIKQHAGEVLTPEQEQELLRLQQSARTQDTTATDTDPGKRERKRYRDMSPEEKDQYFKNLAFATTVASAGISPGGMAYMSGDFWRQGKKIPSLLGGIGVGLKLGSDWLSGYARRNRDLYTLAKRQEDLRDYQVRDYVKNPQYHTNVGGYLFGDGGKMNYAIGGFTGVGEDIPGDPVQEAKVMEALKARGIPTRIENPKGKLSKYASSSIKPRFNKGVTSGVMLDRTPYRFEGDVEKLEGVENLGLATIAGTDKTIVVPLSNSPEALQDYEDFNKGHAGHMQKKRGEVLISYHEDGGKKYYQNGDTVGDPPLSTIANPGLSTTLQPPPPTTMPGIQNTLSLGTTGTQQEKYNFRNPPAGSQLIQGYMDADGEMVGTHYLTPDGQKIYETAHVRADFEDGGKYKKKYNLGGLEGDPPFLLDRSDLRQSDPIIQLNTPTSSPLQPIQLEDPNQETIPRRLDPITGTLVPNVEMSAAPQLDITAAFNAVDGQLATNVGRAPVVGDNKRKRRGRRIVRADFKDGGTYLVGDQITIKDPSGKLVTGVVKDIKDGEIYLD